jgi:hypothetical protein
LTASADGAALDGVVAVCADSGAPKKMTGALIATQANAVVIAIFLIALS